MNPAKMPLGVEPYKNKDLQSISPYRVNLPYYVSDPDVFEKRHMIAGLIVVLHKKEYMSLRKVAYLLQISPAYASELCKSFMGSIEIGLKKFDKEQDAVLRTNPTLTVSPSEIKLKRFKKFCELLDHKLRVNELETDVQINALWFMRHKHPVSISYKLELYIKELLLSKVSASQIQRDTKVRQSVISDLRNGKRQISHLHTDTAMKLIQYYKSIKKWYSMRGLMIAIHAMVPDIMQAHDHRTEYHKNSHGDLMITGWFNNKQFEVLISEQQAGKWFDLTPYVTPKAVEHYGSLYSRIPIKKRAASDAQYMMKDLAARKEL